MALYRLAYARVSTDAQSLDVQLAAFEAIGYEELFQEKISGTRRDRPQFLALISRALELRSHGHDVAVLCHEWTRFARNTAFALETLETLEAADCQVIEATTRRLISLRDADDFLVTGVTSVMAEQFSRKLGERMRISYNYRRKKGLAASNRPPFGYQYKDGKLVRGEHWAIARELVEKFLAGESNTDIRQWLWQQHGIKKSGNFIPKLLSRATLRGHTQYKDGSIIYNTHEALISEAEYKVIQHRFDINRRLRGKNKGKIKPIPNGIVRCAACGKGCVPNGSGPGGSRYFRCPDRNVGCSFPPQGCREDWIEAAIQNEIAEAAEAIADRMVGMLSNDAPDPRIAAKESEIAQLQGLIHLPGIPDTIATLRTEIEQIKTASERETVDDLERREKLLRLGKATPDDWAVLRPMERQAVYRELVSRVLVLGAEVVEVQLHT